MSLSTDEFRAHLELSAATAGVPLPDLTLPDSHHLLLGPMRFHYLDWGIKGLPPVVFLHGGGLNAHTWDIVCAALRRERHCLALDQRGHGESEWSPEMDYATESHAGDVGAFVDALKLERFVLVGMSLGGVERAGVGRPAQPAAGRAGHDRRRSRDPRRGRPQDRRVHLGGHAARLRRAVRGARAQLQSAPQP